MKDTIYREDAIKAFKPLPTIEGLGLQPLITVDDAIKILNGLPSAQPEPQWIPCSERPPEVENNVAKRVIVTTSWTMVCEAHYCVDHWEMNDIDYKNDRIKVRRKGGYEANVYFGDEVRNALLAYHEQRKHIIPASGHEDAMFLSLQNKRITTRAVENLVKKYASKVTTMKKITPHKLRSTYGTNLYRESGDIYLVADVLGHKDVNTTRKHYAANEEERGRLARKLVHLRED